tara:strand:- start:113 stop:556 length:444 start_codon:yes stop_codon:yes gene_type:complete
MKKTILSACILGLTLSGCAKSSKNIQATYVSPLQYQSYSCKQLEMEIGRVSRRVSEISGQQDSQATGDAVAMGVGLVLFWPALFFLIGDDKKEEIGRLKGEYDALEQSAIQKNCSVAKTIQKQKAESAQAAKEAEEQAESQTKKNWN